MAVSSLSKILIPSIAGGLGHPFSFLSMAFFRFLATNFYTRGVLVGISFNSNITRSGSSNKLTHLHHHMKNKSRHTYFHHLSSLWNAIPLIDLNQSFDVIKSRLKKYFWNNFITNFDDNYHCTLHYQMSLPCVIVVALSYSNT